MRRASFYSKPFNSFSARIVLLVFFHALTYGITPARSNSFVPGRNSLSPDTVLVKGTVFSKKKFWWVTGVHAAGYGGSLAALASVWYTGFDRTKLHAFNDMDEWGGMDKLGHANTAWQLSNFSYSLYRYTGMPQKKAALVGSSFSMLYLTTLEFFDGYSAKWGFSFGDMGANLAGAIMGYLRNTGRVSNVQFKFSWWETQYPPYRPDVLGKTVPEQILKDYNGQAYWLCLNLPRQWFPGEKNWLSLALGYSIDGFTGGKQNYFDESIANPPAFERVGEFYLSLDLDVNQLGIRSKWLRQVLKVLNVVKVPFPAVGISTRGKFLFRPLGY